MRTAVRVVLVGLLLLLAPLAAARRAFAEAMGEIHSAETRAGSFANATEVDTFTFSGSAGQVVLLMMSAESPATNEPRLDLRSPSNALVASSHAYNTTEIGPQVLPESGTYAVEARLWVGSSGNYSLSLLVFGGATTSAADGDGGEMQSAETVSGTMDARADTDAWTFDGTAGTGVIVTMSRESGGTSYEPRLRLYDPTGALETSAFGSATATVESWTLLQSGLYTLVTTYRSGTAPGPYSLSLLLLPGPTVSPSDPDGGILASGGSAPCTLDRRADTDAFALVGHAGETVTVTMTGSCGALTLEPLLRLVAPTGVVEASQFGSGTAQIAAHPLALTGAYTAVASRWSGTPPCTYSMSFVKNPPANVLSCSAAAAVVGYTGGWSGSVSGGSAPYAWSWWFGDGGGSTEAEPFHLYPPPARTYAWQLIVRDANGEACVRQGLLQTPSNVVFSDAFESGNLARWHASSP